MRGLMCRTEVFLFCVALPSISSSNSTQQKQTSQLWNPQVVAVFSQGFQQTALQFAGVTGVRQNGLSAA